MKIAWNLVVVTRPGREGAMSGRGSDVSSAMIMVISSLILTRGQTVIIYHALLHYEYIRREFVLCFSLCTLDHIVSVGAPVTASVAAEVGASC